MTGAIRHHHRVDRARQLARKVARNARDKNEWRKVVKVRLWMPVVLQVLLIVALLWYTEIRFDGFINRANITTMLLLAMPLALAADRPDARDPGRVPRPVGRGDDQLRCRRRLVPDRRRRLDGRRSWSGSRRSSPVASVSGSVNAVLIRGFKIPSLIATLATLSILDGISLTLRPTAQGVISDDLVSLLRTSVGPIPIAFIVIVVGAGLLDLWLHASGSGLEVRAVGFDERSAKRGGIRTNWIRVRALAALGRPRRRRRAVRHGPLADRQRPDRELVRAQQHHRRRAWAGRRSPAGGRRSSAAPWPRCCSPSSSPHFRSSDCHPPTAR